jgi:hypothetical protein
MEHVASTDGTRCFGARIAYFRPSHGSTPKNAVFFDIDYQ